MRSAINTRHGVPHALTVPRLILRRMVSGFSRVSNAASVTLITRVLSVMGGGASGNCFVLLFLFVILKEHSITAALAAPCDFAICFLGRHFLRSAAVSPLSSRGHAATEPKVKLQQTSALSRRIACSLTNTGCRVCGFIQSSIKALIHF